MTEPQLQPPATADEARVIEIERTWDDLGDEALEAALTELQNLATSSSLRYGYQRKAHTLAELIDAQFVDVPAANAHHGESAEDDSQVPSSD
jgi:hypothetical protein